MGREDIQENATRPSADLEERGKAGVISHLPWGHLNKEQSSLKRSWETIGLWQNDMEEDGRWATNPEHSWLWEVPSPSWYTSLSHALLWPWFAKHNKQAMWLLDDRTKQQEFLYSLNLSFSTETEILFFHSEQVCVIKRKVKDKKNDHWGRDKTTKLQNNWKLEAISYLF